MSFLLAPKQKKQKPEFTSLAIQTSNSTIPIAIGLGKNRAAPNIIWQGDFQSHKHKQKTGKGGSSGSATYTYTASFVLALGWGTATAVTNEWKDQSNTNDYTKDGFIFFPGTVPQTAWGYLTTNHPTEALGYPGLVLMAVPNLDLGGSNVLPQLTFEVEWPLFNTAPGGKGDADPAQCVDTLLNSTLFGALGGFPMQLDNLFSTGAVTTTGDSAFQTYCQALGFGMSPLLDSQEQCSAILDRWTTIFNTALCWTGYSLSFQPYGADTVTGNGVTYLPDNTLEFALTDDNGDFRYSKGQDPVRLLRKRQSEQPNYGNLEIRNRSNQYNTEPAPWDDQASIDQYGLIPDNSYTAHEICEPAIGVVCAQLYGNRKSYTPNQYEFVTGPGFMAMVVGSKGTTTDPEFGTLTVRVIDMEEQDDGSFKVQVEEYYGSISSTSAAVPETTTNTPVNTGVSANAVNTPLIFEPPSTLAGPTAQVWMAVSAGPSGVFDPNWGGANVYLSTDNVTFQEVGTQETAARMGPLATALASYGGTNPDTIHSFDVDLAESNGDLQSVTAADAAAFVTLSAVQDTPGGPVELLSYQDATLVSGNRYTLHTELFRGLYGTTAGAHTTSAIYARLDDNIFKFDLPAQYIGKTLYIKLQSFNIFGDGVEDLSTCTVYTYVPYGTGFGGGSGGVPTTPTGLSATPSAGYNSLSWTANPASDNVTRYDIYRANGTGASFGSASLIGSSTGTTYTDSTATVGSGYTYFIKAVNAIGSSSPSAGANCTTSSSGASSPFGFAFECFAVTVSKPIGYFDSPIAWTIPSAATDSQGTIGDSDTASAGAPTAQTDFDIQSPPGTSIGTMRFGASSLTATFIKASSSSIPLGQPVVIVAPANLNGLTGAVYGSIKGVR